MITISDKKVTFLYGLKEYNVNSKKDRMYIKKENIMNKSMLPENIQVFRLHHVHAYKRKFVKYAFKTFPINGKELYHRKFDFSMIINGLANLKIKIKNHFKKLL